MSSPQFPAADALEDPADPTDAPPQVLTDLPRELLTSTLSHCDLGDIARAAGTSLLFHDSLAPDSVRLWAQMRSFELSEQPPHEPCVVRWLCFSALLHEHNHPAPMATGTFHSLFIDSEGFVASCGDAPSWTPGLLGHGDAVTHLDTPTRLSSTLDGELPVSVAAGSSFSLVLTAEGSVWRWGRGLAHGKVHSLPKKVEGFEGQRVVAAVAALCHSLVLTADGSVYFWTPGGVWEKIKSFAGQRVIAISTGSDHNLAITVDGSVWSWDVGFGVLPERIDCLVGKHIVAVSAGILHSLALDTDFNIWSWGFSGKGGDDEQDRCQGL